MKPITTTLILALVGGAALALPALEGLAWSPAKDLTLRREMITKQLLVTEGITFTKGEERTVSQRIFDLSSTTTLRTSDQLKQVGEGRPQVLRRFYDEARVDARSEISGGRQRTQTLKFVGESPFEGYSVVFSWVPEDGEYGRYFDSLEGREEMLPRLDEDLGVRDLLPAEPTGEGDSWTLPASVLRGLLGPGGDLGYTFENAKDPLVARSMTQGVGANPFRFLGGQGEGEVKARWARTEEVEGRRLAVIELEFDVKFVSDLTEYANGTRSITEIVSDQVVQLAELRVELDGGGIVRWSLDDGVLFDTQGLRAEQRLTFEKNVLAETGDGPEVHGQTLVMTGSIQQETRVEVER